MIGKFYVVEGVDYFLGQISQEGLQALLVLDLSLFNELLKIVFIKDHWLTSIAIVD